MKKTALIIAAAAVLAAGLATESRACATCGCSAPKVPVAKAACQADCQKACCAATAKATCTAGDSTKCSAAQKAACAAGGPATCSAAQKAACGADCAKPCGAAGKAHGHEYATVDTDGLKKLVASSDEKITLVDARFGKYDDGRRIGDAKQVGAGASDEEIAAALPDKEAKIVAYCSNTKCGASAKLAHRLVDLGYKNVVKYPDGIDGWQEAGGEVKKTK